MVPRLMDKLALRTAIRLAVVPPVAASGADAASRLAVATGVSVFEALLVGTLVGLVPIPLVYLPKQDRECEAFIRRGEASSLEQ
jgi:multidrug efflux pump subunit AcrB